MVKTFWIDLGNVLLHFDFHRATEKLEGKFSVSPQELYSLFFESAVSQDFEQGRITPQEYYDFFRQNAGLNAGFEEFKDAFCDIFWENKEFIRLFKPNIFPSLFLDSIAPSV